MDSTNFTTQLVRYAAACLCYKTSTRDFTTQLVRYAAASTNFTTQLARYAASADLVLVSVGAAEVHVIVLCLRQHTLVVAQGLLL